MGGYPVPTSLPVRKEGAGAMISVKSDDPVAMQPPAKEQVAYDAGKSETARFENMRQAAQIMQADIYAVSDSKFAIYKDGSGQFVTRFTNLRDGSVTYYPEPEVLQYMEKMGAKLQSLVNMDV